MCNDTTQKEEVPKKKDCDKCTNPACKKLVDTVTAIPDVAGEEIQTPLVRVDE